MEAEDDYSVPVIAHAAAFGHDEVVRLLYAKGGRPLIRDADPSALFQGAARGGSKALAEILLSEGIDVNICDSSGYTPLLTAVEWDRRELAQFLMEKGANREAKTKDGAGLFKFACGNGNAALVKELLAAGIKVDPPSFVETAAAGRADIVELLISQSADVNAADATGWTPLTAAIWGRASRVVDYVRSRAASGIASEDDYARVVELLLDHGAKIDLANKDGSTPMNGAARHCGARVMKALLKAGGNPTSEGERPIKMTPIHSAAVDGRSETVKVLLEAGANPKETGNDGNTPLHRAANEGNADAMKVLLAERVPLETKATFNGATALHMAAFTNSGECVRLLLAAGADPNSRDTSGASPLMLAVALELSIKHAQNAPEGRRVRCVLRATDLRSRLETIQLLLEYGAKMDVFPNTHKSLTDFAKAGGSPEIVELLLNPPPATKKPNKP
jgi:ankyrin repeat protein